MRHDRVDQSRGEEGDPVDLSDALRELCDARPYAVLGGNSIRLKNRLRNLPKKGP